MQNLLYQADGRLRGHYVYAVICGKSGEIYIKIGMSSDPLARLDSIRTGCPLVPHTLAFLHVISRDDALRIEAKLHDVLKRWRIHGEWFVFQKTDKTAFNTACAAAMRPFARPSWPLYWKNLKLRAYLAERSRQVGFAKHRWRSKGRAYRDAKRTGLH